ncbi:hypothetical protein GJV06_21800 [Enterobacteriaceae bacterium RIT691]|nr:hypothetical protein [Enterobacteriaceae bacterium RIT691]
MQITSWMSKIKFIIFLLILLSESVVAESKYVINTNDKSINVFNSSGLVSKIPLPLTSDSVDSNFIVLIKELNKINDEYYFSLFQREFSNKYNPEGFCGSGFELWLYISKVQGHNVSIVGKVLAGSCKGSFSMASLESGEVSSETDYSSFKWNKEGFSIEWFSKFDGNGKGITKTVYSIKSDGLHPQ